MAATSDWIQTWCWACKNNRTENRPQAENWRGNYKTQPSSPVQILVFAAGIHGRFSSSTGTSSGLRCTPWGGAEVQAGSIAAGGADAGGDSGRPQGARRSEALDARVDLWRRGAAE